MPSTITLNGHTCDVHDFIKRAIAVPPSIPTSPYHMSDDTNALMDIIMYMAKLKHDGVIPPGTFKYK